LLALCWAAFVLLFFSFSTRQEYYTLPCYSALALLIGAALDRGGTWIRHGSRALAMVTGAAAAAACVLLFLVWDTPAPGDVSQALTRNPQAYTLSLGHMGDLTLEAFAYLRLPLAMAAAGFAIGSAGTWRFTGRSAVGLVVMMLLFVHAARLAMVEFDPYLSSRRLAEALEQSPPGAWIADREYYAFSSLFFYSGRQGLLLNGRRNQVEYGSHAAGAPDVFLDDQEFAARWAAEERYYLATFEEELPRIESLVGRDSMHVVEKSGGKALLSNFPVGSPHDPSSGGAQPQFDSVQ
jgi:hypothetical protein